MEKIKLLLISKKDAAQFYQEFQMHHIPLNEMASIDWRQPWDEVLLRTSKYFVGNVSSTPRAFRATLGADSLSNEEATAVMYHADFTFKEGERAPKKNSLIRGSVVLDSEIFGSSNGVYYWYGAVLDLKDPDACSGLRAAFLVFRKRVVSHGRGGTQAILKKVRPDDEIRYLISIEDEMCVVYDKWGLEKPKVL
jgi:hypothetical protein